MATLTYHRPLNRILAHAELCPEFGHRNLLAYLKRKQLQQPAELIGMPNIFELQNTLEQISGNQLLQIALMSRVGVEQNYFRIAPVENTVQAIRGQKQAEETECARCSEP